MTVLQSWEALPPDTATFTPDITPLILAAHRDNYEIIKILLDRGAILPTPHDVRLVGIILLGNFLIARTVTLAWYNSTLIFPDVKLVSYGLLSQLHLSPRRKKRKYGTSGFAWEKIRVEGSCPSKIKP